MASAEFQLHQHNNNISGDTLRPLCPPGTNDRFWAEASLRGATLAIVVNDGTAGNTIGSDMEMYIDSDHLLDPCNQGSIGFGIGKPTEIPELSGGDPGFELNQVIHADMRLEPGDNGWSHIWAATKYVQNNSAPKQATTSCMGLSINPALPWPENEVGRGTDMLLLNRDRQ